MTPTLLRTALPLVVAITLSAGVAAGAGTSTLGTWMKANMGAPLAGEDFSTLAKSFDLVAGKPPPSAAYPRWSAIAKTGSAAASKQDAAGVKAACKDCHDSYRAKYKKEFPTLAFP